MSTPTLTLGKSHVHSLALQAVAAHLSLPIEISFSDDVSAAPVMMEGKDGGEGLTQFGAQVRQLVRLAGKPELLGSDEATQGLVADALMTVADYTGSLDAVEELLMLRTFLAGVEFSVADVAALGAFHAVVSKQKKKLTKTHPNVCRWYTHAQQLASYGEDVCKTVTFSIAPSPFFNGKTDFFAAAAAAAGVPIPAVAPTKSQGKEGKDKGKTSGDEENKQQQAPDDVAAARAAKKAEKKAKQANKEKKAKKGPPPVIALADIRVGRILSAYKHPDADRLYVEEIDVGEAAPRTVVSGLAEHMALDRVTGLVCVLVNVKAGDMMGVVSNGRVLVATSADGKTKELVVPAEGSKPGEAVVFEGIPAAVDGYIPGKKLNKLVKELNVGNDKKARYNDVLFQTSAGHCSTTTITAGTIA